uniref:Uncharacterized protein n=1 Tax=Physcomitrium patens TaxID=3218 RepID=A0A2K1JIS0_PHYPA|nr:hypothetical protein PHYPA_018845 [Physcomitrium patens]
MPKPLIMFISKLVNKNFDFSMKIIYINLDLK